MVTNPPPPARFVDTVTPVEPAHADTTVNLSTGTLGLLFVVVVIGVALGVLIAFYVLAVLFRASLTGGGGGA